MERTEAKKFVITF